MCTQCDSKPVHMKELGCLIKKDVSTQCDSKPVHMIELVCLNQGCVHPV